MLCPHVYMCMHGDVLHGTNTHVDAPYPVVCVHVYVGGVVMCVIYDVVLCAIY